jgi:hypothetical protein
MVHSLSPSPDKNENKRTAERHRTLKSGRIEVNGHSSTFDVTIRDMSDSGARLVLKAVWIAPERFDLLVLNPNSGKADRHACQRAWQKGTLLGVRFID